MRNLTLEDVARQAGVSRSTVSRVVNNDPNVKECVRLRVQEVICITGYHPHAAARSLATQRSYMIGLVLPRTASSFFIDPYFPRLTQGIAQACNQHNYTLGFFLVETPEDEHRIFPHISRRGQLDGIILQSAQLGDALIEQLAKVDFPVVVVGRPFNPDQVSYINVDNAFAAQNAVNHLIRLGYRRIGTITGPIDSTTGIDRLEGYRSAIIAGGLRTEEALVVQGDFTEISGYFAMRRLLAARPEAVFAASDTMAIGAFRAVREAGLNIPTDLALIGFDDLPIAAQAEYRLTTVRQPIVQFGAQAVELLLDLIENGISPPRRVLMDTELIIRESCGATIKHEHLVRH